MRDLKPTGIPVQLDDKERHLLFTLNAIDEIQEYYDEPLEAVMDRLTNEEEYVKTLRHVVYVLLKDEAERMGDETILSQREVGWLIHADNMGEITLKVIKAYGISLPQGDEDSPGQSGQ